MSREDLKREITKAVVLDMKRHTGNDFVPVAVSARHVHLTQEAVDALFGKGYKLGLRKNLSQPRQFACDETITVVGPKGVLKNVRVLGPVRKAVQVELSVTDAYKIGILPVTRMSGDVEGTPGGQLLGPAGDMVIEQGIIIAARHLHIAPRQAKVYTLSDGDVIRLKAGGERGVIFEDVLVRCGDDHDLEAHIDFDEANSARIKNGDILEIVR